MFCFGSVGGHFRVFPSSGLIQTHLASRTNLMPVTRPVLHISIHSVGGGGCPQNTTIDSMRFPNNIKRSHGRGEYPRGMFDFLHFPFKCFEPHHLVSSLRVLLKSNPDSAHVAVICDTILESASELPFVHKIQQPCRHLSCQDLVFRTCRPHSHRVHFLLRQYH